MSDGSRMGPDGFPRSRSIIGSEDLDDDDVEMSRFQQDIDESKNKSPDHKKDQAKKRLEKKIEKSKKWHKRLARNLLIDRIKSDH